MDTFTHGIYFQMAWEEHCVTQSGTQELIGMELKLVNLHNFCLWILNMISSTDWVSSIYVCVLNK